MDYLDKYLKGHTVEVYNDLIKLGEKDYNEILPEAEKVFAELFRRVRYNLEIIYAELEQIGYKFRQNPKYDFEKPLVSPVFGGEPSLAAARSAEGSEDDLLQKMAKLESKKIHMPLSLQFFYKYVGACNFSWDYKNYPDIPWELSDPIQIGPLSDVMDSFLEELDYYEKEGGEEYNEFIKCAGLDVSADYLHKDNISGGAPYSVQTTEKPTLDSLLLHEENGTTFINYLRICFENCGFSRAYELEDTNEFLAFCERVRPKLLKI